MAGPSVEENIHGFQEVDRELFEADLDDATSPRKPIQSSTMQFLAAAQTICKDVLKIKRALSVRPGSLNPEEIREIQEAVDDMLLRAVAELELAKLTTEELAWSTIQLVGLIHTYEYVFRTRPIPGDDPSDLPPYEVRLKPNAVPVTVADPCLPEATAS